MKISNRFVEIQIENDNTAVVLRFPLSDAKITLTREEAKQLRGCLAILFEEGEL